MIRFRADAVLIQIARQRFGAFSAGAIDDAALARPTPKKREQLLIGSGFRHDAVTEIGPIETRDVAAWVAQLELFDDVDLDPLGRRRGQGHNRHLRELRPQLFQLAILRPEIVAPFADAMGFVDGDLADVPVQGALAERVEHQALGRDVEQSVLAAVQAAPARRRFRSIQGGVQVSRRNPAGPEGVDLIFHERNQGRDDNR